MRYSIRLSALALTTVLLAVMLAACSGNADSDTGRVTSDNSGGAASTNVKTTSETPSATTPAAPEEKKTIRILVVDAGTSKLDDPNLFLTQQYAEASGANVELVPVPDKDFGAKFTTMIASGDLPDLMFLNNLSFLQDYYSKGLFLPLEQEYASMPNLQAQLAKYPNYGKDFKQSDGHFYTFPFIAEVTGSQGIIASTKLAKAAGIDFDDVKTLDDFHTLLTGLKDALGGKAPWVGRKNIRNIDFITPLFGTGRSYYYNSDSGRYQFGPIDPNYKLMVQSLAQWYQEGLIHKDFFTMDPETYDALIANEEAGLTIEALSKGLLSYQADPANEKWTPLLPPQINGRAYYAMIQSPNTRLDSYWVVNAKTEALPEIKKLVDWAYSPEGVETTNFGIEGRDFVRLPNGNPTFQKEGASLDDAKKAASELKGLYSVGFFRNIFVVPATSDGSPWYDSYEFDAREVYKANNAYGPPVPNVTFTKEEQDQRKVLETPIATYVDEQLAKFVTGARPIGEYDKFVEELNAMNAADVLAVYNAALDRYNAQ